MWQELLELSVSRQPPRLYEGYISEDAADLDSQVHVIVLAFDQELEWGPAPWMPRVNGSGDAVLPAEGDRCVVGLAESPEPGTPEVWILAWWPNG